VILLVASLVGIFLSLFALNSTGDGFISQASNVNGGQPPGGFNGQGFSVPLLSPRSTLFPIPTQSDEPAGTEGAKTAVPDQEILNESSQVPSEATVVIKGPTAADCRNGKSCSVGQKGPAGGVVFYAAASRQSWGRYLEAAPMTPSSAPKAEWCKGYYDTIDEALDQGIGSGRGNSLAMLNLCESGAATVADRFTAGGKSDWFLPSADELFEWGTYLYAKRIRPAVNVWSSTNEFSDSAYYQELYLGSQGLGEGVSKSESLLVWPVRAF